MPHDARLSVTQRIAKLIVQIDAKISTLCDLPYFCLVNPYEVLAF